MKPVLFSVGNFNVYSFGIFLGLSFVLSTFMLWKYAKEELKEEEYLDVYLYSSLFGLIAARVSYIIANFNEFGFNFLRWILVRETPGLSLSFGLAGFFLFYYLLTGRKNLKKARAFDIVSITLSYALIFIKIGELMGGAAFGRNTSIFTGIMVVGKLGKYHPVELYEAFWYLSVFVILTLVYRFIRTKKLPDGMLFLGFVFLSSLGIFILEFFKVMKVYLYKFSLIQIVYIPVIIVSGIYLFKKIILVKKILKG